MSLRFLSDQCVPAEITGTLRRHGYQITLLREVLPIRSPDPEVIAKAQELGAVMVSLNGDFADIVAYPPASYLGIIAIQLHNERRRSPPDSLILSPLRGFEWFCCPFIPAIKRWALVGRPCRTLSAASPEIQQRVRDMQEESAI